MVLRLNPALAVVWRSPSCLQVGADEPLGVLSAVTPATERVVTALRTGAPRSALVAIAAHYGGDAALVDRVLSALRPALLPQHPVSNAGTVRVQGVGAEADALRARLQSLSFLAADPGRGRSLTIIVADYVVSPGAQTALMCHDDAHLPVIFGDQRVEVGPLVEPGDGPCLRCVSLARRDADPAWPAISAQLSEQCATTRGSLAGEEAVLQAVRAVQAWSSGAHQGTVAHGIRIDAASGQVTRAEYRPHPECGCQALPRIATVRALHGAGRPPAPSSARAGVARG